MRFKVKTVKVIALAQAVEANPSLRLLNLGDNTFGQKGAVAMAKVYFII